MMTSTLLSHLEQNIISCRISYMLTRSKVTIEAPGLRDLHQFTVNTLPKKMCVWEREKQSAEEKILTCDLRAVVRLILKHYVWHSSLHCTTHLWLNSTTLHFNCFITMIVQWKTYRSVIVRHPCISSIMKAKIATTRAWTETCHFFNQYISSANHVVLFFYQVMSLQLQTVISRWVLNLRVFLFELTWLRKYGLPENLP